jgi:DNA-binding MarR family transcriptional regulator
MQAAEGRSLKMAKKDKPEKGKKKRDQETVADGTLSTTLIQTARAMRTLLARDLVDHGLYAGQEMVILSLAEADGKSPGVIAAELGVRAPTITKTVNRLMAQGFVEKRDNGSDGRRTEIALTARGQETLASIRQATAGVEQALLAGLSGKETRQLAKLLKKLEENVSETTTPQA